MLLRTTMKTLLSGVGLMVMLTILSDSAFALRYPWGGGGSGGSGGSVPEIDGGSAAAALTALGGGLLFLRDKLHRSNDEK